MATSARSIAFRACRTPNGEWIVFVVGGQVKKIPISGGATVTLIDGDVAIDRAVTWLDDGTILAVRQGFGSGFLRVPEAGGAATPIPLDGLSLNQLSPLPEGRGALFRACTPPCAEPELWSIDLGTGTAQRVVADALFGQYLATEHLVYVRSDGTLMAAEFDLGSLQMRGAPVPVLDGISASQNAPLIGISRSGTLVMRSGLAQGSQQYDLVWVDQSGQVTAVDSSETFRLTAFAANQGWAARRQAMRWPARGPFQRTIEQ